jgi:RimJ/RimL family protein N-acetyltransferase
MCVLFRLLNDTEINEICLFVDPANAAAARVYGRVGFIGLETGIPDQSTEEWAELGFEGVALLDF